MKCPVCHQDKYKETRGIEEQDYSDSWILTQPNSGFCSRGAS